MTLYDELAALNIGEQREVLFCFDLLMREDDARKQFQDIIEFSLAAGVKIVHFDRGSILWHENQSIDNKRCNKVLITFEKIATGSNEIKPELVKTLADCFRERIVK